MALPRRTTRELLLGAAQEEFSERGWEQATGVGIRKRARVSHGSWAHFSPGGKCQIAAEIYTALHNKLWPECLNALEAYGGNQPAAIKDTVQRLVAAVERDHMLFRLLFLLERALFQTEKRSVVDDLRTTIHARLAAWATTAFSCDVLRSLPGPVIHAVTLGPALAVCGDWLNEELEDAPNTWAECLAEGAFAVLAALSGSAEPDFSGPNRRAKNRTKPRRARDEGQPSML